MMLQVANRKGQGYLNEDNLSSFPYEVLLTIDRLWVEASNGYFGFSVQKKIWEKYGSPTSFGNNYTKFTNAVGWEIKSDIIPDLNNFKFSIFHSLLGELPVFQKSMYNSGLNIKVSIMTLFSRNDL